MVVDLARDRLLLFNRERRRRQSGVNLIAYEDHDFRLGLLRGHADPDARLASRTVTGHELLTGWPVRRTVNRGCQLLPWMESWEVKHPGRKAFSQEETARNPIRAELQ